MHMICSSSITITYLDTEPVIRHPIAAGSVAEVAVLHHRAELVVDHQHALHRQSEKQKENNETCIRFAGS